MATQEHSSTGARPARLNGAPAPSLEVTIPRHVVCAAQFALAQTAARLERIVTKPPGRIDAAILTNARDALLALHAAIELARGKS